MEDFTELYEADLRVFTQGGDTWTQLKGEGLLVASSVESGVRLGDELWCLGGTEDATVGWVLLSGCVVAESS